MIVLKNIGDYVSFKGVVYNDPPNFIVKTQVLFRTQMKLSLNYDM